MKRVFLITALILLLLFCLISCSGVLNINENNSEHAQDPQMELAPENALILSENGESKYVLVCNEENQKRLDGGILTFSSTLHFRADADLTVVSDATTETAKEILLGEVENRREDDEVLAQITAPKKVGYRVRVIGEKIVVESGNDELLAQALGAVKSAIAYCGNGMYGIPKDFSATFDLPVYREESVTVQSFGKGSYTANYNVTNYKEYQKFLQALQNDGFTQYSVNRIGRNEFATYVKDTGYDSMAVHLMFYDNLFNFKMTYGSLGFLPNVQEISAPAQNAVTPSVTQIGRDGATNTAPGMSCVVQLADASFIIFDGGPDVGLDSKRLYDFLCEKTPNGARPVIAAWFITHAHGDHVSLANSFLCVYSDRVELRIAAYNFPDFDSATIANENKESMRKLAEGFQSASQFLGAEQWVIHTGQTLRLPGCEVEVLYTPEDYGVLNYPWGNHTCTAIRVTVNGTTLVVLGDAEKTLCQRMADVYGSSIQSDILSLSHHGFNGACYDLYKAINPKICLWPVDRQRFLTDSRCLGTQPGYNFNAWIRNDAIQKREHYTADETVTIPC